MADTVSVTCPECKKAVKIPEEMLGRKLRCKGCDETFVARAAKKAAPVVKKPTKKAAAGGDDADDDGKQYGVTEEYLGARCPECANPMEEEDAIICLHCGYNTRTRQRAESKSVEEQTALDYFLWWLPGIACVLAFLALVGFDVWYCLDINRIVGEEWYSFIASGGVKLWIVVFSLWPMFYALKFAVKRLIFNYEPPERLVRRPK